MISDPPAMPPVWVSVSRALGEPGTLSGEPLLAGLGERLLEGKLHLQRAVPGEASRHGSPSDRGRDGQPAESSALARKLPLSASALTDSRDTHFTRGLNCERERE